MKLFYLFLFFAGLTIYFIGYYRGETAKKRRKYRCNGKEHKLNRTGWDERFSIPQGHPMYHCSICDAGFNEKKEKIPEVVGDFLFAKQLGESYPEAFGEEWDQIVRYIKPTLPQKK